MYEYHYNTRYLSTTGCEVVNEVIILCLPLASPLQLTLTAYGGPGIPCFLEFYHQYTRVVHVQKAKDLLVYLATSISRLMYSKELTIIIFNHNGRIWRSDDCIWRYRFTRAENHNGHEFFNLFWYVIIHHRHIEALKAIIVPKWS